jgi:glutamyl-tRNA reductase
MGVIPDGAPCVASPVRVETRGDGNMQLLLVGVNHRTATLEEREALALREDEARTLLADLTGRGLVPEAVALSTCNRTEFYAVAETIAAADEHIREAVRAVRDGDLLAPGPQRYVLTGGSAAEHLFRVACGLDSMVLGDVQILGQVKEAYTRARQAGAAGVVLDRLFETALRAGKRARRETTIGAGTVSIASAAVELAETHGPLQGCRVLIIGAGETARLAARHVAQRGPAAIVVANRDLSRAAALAESVGGRGVALAALGDALAAADVVVSATRAPATLVSAALVRQVRERRAARPLLMIDLAMPRDIEPEARHVAGVTLHAVDSIQAVVGEGLGQRAAQVPWVERIIADECARFDAWWRGLEATPVVVALRDHFERVRLQELERMRHLPPDERARADRLTRALINRLLHVPTLRLKSDAASDEGHRRLIAAQELFALSAATPQRALPQAE